MTTHKYTLLETKIIETVGREGNFFYKGESYNVLKVGKPRPQLGSGEPKTDVYIFAESNGYGREFKISVKSRGTNEFQENKVSAERAEGFFGPNYAEIIERTTRSICSSFYKQPLLFQSGKHPTKPNSVTLGWKLEIADRKRKLSAPLQLSDQEIRDYVYKGINLPENKRNAVVNNEIIFDSGVAEFMLYTEVKEINKASDIFENIQPIDIVELKPTYLIFTANNYRTVEQKSDGARPLAVRVNWDIVNGKLTHSISFDKPLAVTGKDLVPDLLRVFAKLGKHHPSEFIPTDLADPSILLP